MLVCSRETSPGTLADVELHLPLPSQRLSVWLGLGMEGGAREPRPCHVQQSDLHLGLDEKALSPTGLRERERERARERDVFYAETTLTVITIRAKRDNLVFTHSRP